MAHRFVDADPTGDWSAEACRTVATDLTSSIDLGDYRDAIIEIIVWMHFGVTELGERVHTLTGREYHASPQQLLSMLYTFRDIVQEQREQIEDQQRFRLVGLDKLQATVEQVEELRASLASKQARLEAANQEANDRLQRMVEQQQAAEMEREASLALQEALHKQEAMLEEQRASVLDELAEAEPAVLHAQAAVSNIKKQHLSEVRSMANPPAPVKLAMESVCILLGHYIDGWKSVQSILRRDDFISTVVHLDTAHALPRAIRERVRHEYLDRREYNYEAIHRASTACGPLAQWVMAQVRYADILERIGPLRERVAALEDEAAATRAEAAQAQETLAAIEKSIGAYKREYADLIRETQALTHEMEAVQKRVQRSMQLLEGLSGERERWEQGREAFQAQIRTVLGDSLLCAAMIAYAGFFDQACRTMLWHAWQSRLETLAIPVRTSLSLADTLSTADERAAWHASGLPVDALSIDNAVMLQRCSRVPLLIDPSGRIVPFLMSLYGTDAAPVNVTSFLDGGCVQMIERALRFGTTLVITEAEHLDSILLPVLNREKRHTGGRVLVRVGTLDVDWSPTFRLVLVTRHSGLSLSPALFARVQIVNFTLTRQSMQDQALAQLLHVERPDMETQRSSLLATQNELQRRLQRLEQALLTALNETQGHILEDERVIQTLETLKAEVDDVAAQAASTTTLMQQVETSTQAYKPLADACSHLYFTLDLLTCLHPFYRFDRPFFQRIFERVLRLPRESEGNEEKRRGALYDALFTYTYLYTAPALLQADRLVLALVLAQLYCRAGPKAGALEGEDMQALLDGRETPTLAWAAHEKARHAADWDAWLSCPTPEQHPAPLPAKEDEVDALVRQALLLRTYRPDRLEPALMQLLRAVVGVSWLEMPLPTLAEIAEHVDATTPIAVCGVSGYDASAAVEACAVSQQQACTAIMLGTHDAHAQADAALSSASKAGTWVLLQNAHLAPTWIADVPSRLATWQSDPHSRIWMTCELTPSVPTALMDAAQVVMYEPPAGLKAGLLTAWHALQARPTTPGPMERERVYMLVSVVHTIALERTRHAPLGWSQAYEFFDTDLEAAWQAVDTCLAAAMTHAAQSHLAPDGIPWDALQTLLAQGVYGGRMETDVDRRMLDALLGHVLCEEAFASEFVIAPHATQPWIAPDGGKRATWHAWIQALPEPQPVHWLLLAPAAERAVAATAAMRALERVAEVQRRAARAWSWEKDVDQPVATTTTTTAPAPVVAAIDAWLSLVPASLPASPATDMQDPWHRFWAQEQATAMAWLDRVRPVLAAWRQAQRTEPADVDAWLCEDRVPPAWQSGTAPTSLRAWLTYRQAQYAYAIAPPSVSEPVALARLASPTAYLTATRQMAARALSTSLELLHAHWCWDEPERAAPSTAWPLGAIQLDGAAWTDQGLVLNEGTTSTLDRSWLVWTQAPLTESATSLRIPLCLDAKRQTPILSAVIPLAEAHAPSTKAMAILHGIAAWPLPP